MKRLFFIGVLVFYISGRLYSAQWIQSGETAFSEGETSNTQIYGVGADANISLKAVNYEKRGNDFIVEDQTEYKIDSTDKKYSCRFTSQKDITASKVLFCIYLTQTGWPTYTVGLQEDDNSPGHYPSGTWLSSATFTPSAVSGLAGKGHGWQEVALANQYSLTAGTTYHLVFEYLSGTIDSSNCMTIYGTDPRNSKVPKDNSLDLMSNQLYYNGYDWSAINAQPLFVLASDSGDVDGNPFYKVDEDLKIFGSIWRGEIISVGQGDVNINRIIFNIRSNSSNPSNKLYFVIENVTDQTVVASEEIDSSDISTYYKGCEHVLNQPRVLRAGKKYRIYLKSPSSVSENCYMVRRLSINKYEDPAEKSNQNLIDASFGGGQSYYTQWDGVNWTDQTGPEKYADLIFYFQSSSYYSAGDYTSKAFDTSYPSEFKYISWSPESQPEPASLKFKIASSDDSSGPWNFYGPDGTRNTYYTNSSGQEINTIHNGKRYIKYKAFFGTSNNLYSPNLDEVAITYQERPMTGSSMEVYNNPNPFNPPSETTAIRYILEKDSKVTIKIFTLLGDLVKKMEFSPGEEGGRGEDEGYENAVIWDGDNGGGMTVADGVYICQIVAEARDGSKLIKETRKIAVIK